MNICDKKFKSIFDIKDRSFTTRNYLENVPPPNKNQITGSAMVHILKFLDWCENESRIKYEFRKTKLER